jgi:hypothetical protein
MAHHKQWRFHESALQASSHFERPPVLGVVPPETSGFTFIT